MSILSKTLSKLAKIASWVDNIITSGVFTRKAIYSHIKEYGEMIEFKIDNKARKISTEVLLKENQNAYQFIS